MMKIFFKLFLMGLIFIGSTAVAEERCDISSLFERELENLHAAVNSGVLNDVFAVKAFGSHFYLPNRYYVKRSIREPNAVLIESSFPPRSNGTYNYLGCELAGVVSGFVLYGDIADCELCSAKKYSKNKDLVVSEKGKFGTIAYKVFVPSRQDDKSIKSITLVFDEEEYIAASDENEEIGKTIITSIREKQ